LDNKVDLKNVEENCAERTQVEQMSEQLNQLIEQVDSKCDLQRFEDFEAEQIREVNAFKDIITKKSNIKDVCALLDMKSSK
jgi:ferritin